MMKWTWGAVVVTAIGWQALAWAECKPAAESLRIRVTLEPPPGVQIAGVVIAVTYPTDKLVIEGQGKDAGLSAVTSTPSGAVVASDDRDGELRQVIASPKALAPGKLFDVTFKRCEGAAPAMPSELSCRVLDASDTKTTKVDGVRCSVAAAS